MLKPLENLPDGVDGLQATGKISKQDYDATFLPMIERARRTGKQLRFLYQLGPGFEGYDPLAAWEDAKLGLRALRLFDGCAVVSDVEWVRNAARATGFVLPFPVRVYDDTNYASAVEWLRTLPEHAAISQRILPELGVMVVDIRDALRAQDFEALASTADPWIEAHGSLRGLVIHAREFPGWENLEGFVRHVRFVREHYRKIQRIALAVDSKVLTWLPKLAQRLGQVEVHSFSYADLDRAIHWAGAARIQTQAAATN